MDWIGSARKLTKFVTDYTVKDWNLKEEEGKLSLYHADQQVSDYLSPQLICYILSGILVGAGYDPKENAEDQLQEARKGLN